MKSFEIEFYEVGEGLFALTPAIFLEINPRETLSYKYQIALVFLNKQICISFGNKL